MYMLYIVCINMYMYKYKYIYIYYKYIYIYIYINICMCVLTKNRGVDVSGFPSFASIRYLKNSVLNS